MDASYLCGHLVNARTSISIDSITVFVCSKLHWDPLTGLPASAIMSRGTLLHAMATR